MAGLVSKNVAKKSDDVISAEDLPNQPATEKQLDWLKTLLWERGFSETNADKIKTRGEASAAINDIKTKPSVPATDEQLHEIDELATAQGVTIVNDDLTRTRANKILLSLRRKANNNNIPRANSDFLAHLEAEVGAAKETTVENITEAEVSDAAENENAEPKQEELATA